jgi:hypothetical protein
MGAQPHGAYPSSFQCDSQIIKLIRTHDNQQGNFTHVDPLTLKQWLLSEIETRPIEIHQNGHLRINITINGHRFDLHIHMQNPLVRIEKDFRMHDHTFDLHSYVLKGELEDVNFQLSPNIQGKYFIVRTESRDGRVDPNKNLSVYRTDEGRFNLIELNRTPILAGQAYWLSRGVVHESNPRTESVITITQRILAEKPASPVVLAPVEAEAELDHRMKFDRQAFNHAEGRRIAKVLVNEINSQNFWNGLSTWISHRIEKRSEP